ncbi:nitric oxide synthase oxygenase [Tengunoibacter tsumagoiensis]|nr:nitric oxide synthase oxygenase [Tengunoibacter tsumagoiensis]
MKNIPEIKKPFVEPKVLLSEARAFLRFFHQEQGIMHQTKARMLQIEAEIERSGSYWQTYDEIAYGAKVAWRQSLRCIGRLHWQSLNICDRRKVTTAEGVFEALLHHLRQATNNGKIRPYLTLFAPQQPGQPGIRIWNAQLLQYAGYRQLDGKILGDPANQDLTEILLQLGWKQRKRSAFDLLPLVIQMPGQAPQLFEIPRSAVLEVPLQHPEYRWFADLGLKWYAVPVISNMRLEIGGVSYTAAPFNGWYMGTEIGSRNLGDRERYYLLPVIAEKLGLAMNSERTLWKDRALLELNSAVLYSFAQAGVTMIDHHTAAQQFLLHEEREARAGRKVYADWGWIVPPMSSSATPVFHQTYEQRLLTPNLFAQQPPWRDYTLTMPAQPTERFEIGPSSIACPTKGLLSYPARDE